MIDCYISFGLSDEVIVAYVIGVLDKDVFTLGLLEHEVRNCSYDTPTIGQRDIHLSCEIFGLVVLDTNDDVVGGILWCSSRDVSIDQLESHRMRKTAYPIFMVSAPARTD